jgi:tRNA threonylcarbamoyladenosine biosynthesis protein TsaE
VAATAADAPIVIGLCGELGAGKTLFAQGLAEGLGVDSRQVSSPTFTIASEYSLSSGARLAHIDLYRLEDPAELEAVGFVDLLEPGNVLAIEWADRFPSQLPDDRLEVRLERCGLARDAEFADASAPATPRRITATARGAVSSALLERWQRELAARGLGAKREAEQERGT